MTDTFFKVLQIAAILGGLIGLGAIISHRVNKNFDDRFAQEKKEREAREAARVDEMMLMHEGITAVGHVARVTAEAHLAKCGPNEKLTTTLTYHDKYREKEDTQMRRNAAMLIHCEGGR